MHWGAWTTEPDFVTILERLEVRGQDDNMVGSLSALQMPPSHSVLMWSCLRAHGEWAS